jgi:hypothetical protein
MLTYLIIFLVIGFIGFAIGRIGDNYVNFWIGDPKWLPDHWIYGLLLMILGFWLFSGYVALCLFSFGLGHFISDLKDFWNLKFYGSDNKKQEATKFWHID